MKDEMLSIAFALTLAAKAQMRDVYIFIERTRSTCRKKKMHF